MNIDWYNRFSTRVHVWNVDMYVSSFRQWGDIQEVFDVMQHVVSSTKRTPFMPERQST